MECSQWPTPTQTQTPIKKWVQLEYAKLFRLADTDTDTDANGLQTHFVCVGICVGVSVGQCEHSINQFLS